MDTHRYDPRPGDTWCRHCNSALGEAPHDDLEWTRCKRCGSTLTLADTEAPRYLHPSGEAVCDIDHPDGYADSGEPEGMTGASWLAELFEYEYCAECGGDAQHHTAVPLPIAGEPFARCDYPTDAEGNYHPTIAAFRMAEGVPL